MRIAVQVEPGADAPPAVEYRWDEDTDILSARLQPAPQGDGAAGSVEVAGAAVVAAPQQLVEPHIRSADVGRLLVGVTR